MKWHEHKKNKIEKRTDARIKEFNNIYKEFSIDDRYVHTTSHVKQLTTEYLLQTPYFSGTHIQYPHYLIKNKTREQLKKRIYIRTYKDTITKLILWCKRINARHIDMKYLVNQVGTQYGQLLKHHKIVFQQYNTNNQITQCYNMYRRMKDYYK